MRAFFIFITVLFSAQVCTAQTEAEENRCIRLVNAGQEYLFQFKPAEAVYVFDSLIVLAKKTNHRGFLAQGYLGAGQAKWYMGRIAGAIDTMMKSVVLLRAITKEKETGASRWALVASLRILGNIYDATGEYDKEFAVVTEAIARCKKNDDKQNIILSLVQMGNMYRSTGDYVTAALFYRDAEKWNPREGDYDYRELYQQVGILQAAQGNYDSALFYYRKALIGHPKPVNVFLRIGECYILQQKWSEASRYLVQVYATLKQQGEMSVIVPAMISLGKIYLHNNQPDSALFFAGHGFRLAAAKYAKHNQRDAALVLSQVFERIHNSDSALFYYKISVTLRDEVLSEQFKGQLYAFKKRSEAAAQQSQLKLLKWGIAGFALVALCVIVLLVLRHRHERLKLQQRSAELEMKALRAQMNPHFVFNCLSAINHFILNKDTEKASEYLTKFARLIRLVLINSEKATVTLEEELNMLKLYLEMEQLRFKDAFDYEIRYDPVIHPSMISIPSFILQPFCENAIWHGLLHKDGKGKLLIDLSMQDDCLVCLITDNGIGRKKAEEIKTKKPEGQKSFGHTLTAERLSIFNDRKKTYGSFVIEDITDNNGNNTGTRVILRIRQKNTV